jgi:membrane-associated phospholipid phosphatase
LTVVRGVVAVLLLLTARPVFSEPRAPADQAARPADPPPALAQRQEQSPANPRRPVWRLFTDIASDFAHLPSRDTAAWLAAGGGLALLGHPLDGKLNRRLVGSEWVDEVFDPGKIIGYGAVQIGAATLTYTWGKVGRQPKVVHLGVDLLRAQIVAQTITFGMKYSIRRERPDGSSGFAFPSGHASVTFASATVLQRHLGWRAALPTYSVASYVAASRMHENRHFLSDVIFGAAVGIVSGRTVTRHGRDAWGVTAVPVKGGAAILIRYFPRTEDRQPRVR